MVGAFTQLQWSNHRSSGKPIDSAFWTICNVSWIELVLKEASPKMTIQNWFRWDLSNCPTSFKFAEPDRAFLRILVCKPHPKSKKHRGILGPSISLSSPVTRHRWLCLRDVAFGLLCGNAQTDLLGYSGVHAATQTFVLGSWEVGQVMDRDLDVGWNNSTYGACSMRVYVRSL